MNPGSDEARSKGCTCPVMDNGYGKGYMGGVKDEDGNMIFIMSMSCPIHGRTLKQIKCPLCDMKDYEDSPYSEEWSPCNEHQIVLDAIWDKHAGTDASWVEIEQELLKLYPIEQIRVAVRWWTE